VPPYKQNVAHGKINKRRVTFIPEPRVRHKKIILRLIFDNESQTKLWFYIGINLDYEIDVPPGLNLTPGINIADGNSGKKNKRSTLNKRK
jgi:hypothetical protein